MRRNLMSNFVFLNVKFNKYHYTDCRVGSPLYYLAYMLKGRAKIVAGDDSIQIEAGDVFFIPKNLGYESYWWGEDEIDFLSYGFVSLQTDEDINRKLQKIMCDSKMKEKIQNILPKNHTANCETLSRFYSVMARLLCTMEKAPKSRVDCLCDKVKRSIKEDPTASLREIAQKCMISEPYMYASFKKATGKTPNEYRQKVLCERAVELLITTDKTVEEIAFLTSFSSSSYMRKIIKKFTDSTPAQIRQKNGF